MVANWTPVSAVGIKGYLLCDVCYTAQVGAVLVIGA